MESTMLEIIYKNADKIMDLLFWALGIFGIYSTVYWIIGFFFTRKFGPAKQNHKYGICIAARNEEGVIGNLLDSIARQDYPKELLTVFVVADNCTDHTAQVAREKGAVVYERFDDARRTKGFALQFLFKNIEKDYGVDSFEGYFVFDADNLLNKDYVTRMNESFDTGLKIITSYRNTKNFDENWIASTYALHWLRSIRKNHRTRSFLRLATNVQGTGFLFAHELVKDGWNYTSLTEDRAFTADAVARGYEISYNDAAVFFDEQPTSLKIALRQRLRWSKGHLMAFAETGWALFSNIFVGNRYRDKSQKRPFFRALLEEIRHRWASFDTFAQLFPAVVIRTAFWIIVSLFGFSALWATKGLNNWQVFNPDSSNVVTKFLHWITGDWHVSAEPGVSAFLVCFGIVILWRVVGRLKQHLEKMFVALYVFIIERKRIIRIPWYKKLLYCITFPVFDLIHRYTTYVALFVKVTWKPIPHTSKVKIEDIEQ